MCRTMRFMTVLAASLICVTSLGYCQESDRIERSRGGYRVELRNYATLVSRLETVIMSDDLDGAVALLEKLGAALREEELIVSNAKKLFAIQEKILKETPETRPYIIGYVADEAERALEYVKAGKYAEDAVKLGGSGGSNAGRNIYYGQQVLGLLALRQGDTESAKARLLAAAAAPRWSGLAQRGPNVVLARRLLDRGEREVVREFLDRCKRIWPEGITTLENWREDIRVGKVPDFGRNLVFSP